MSSELTLSPIVAKFVKFVFVGLISTVINYGLFASLYISLGIYYIISSIVGYFSGLIVGYYLNKNWTYGSEIENNRKYFHKYLVVYLCSLLSSTVFLFALVEMNICIPLISNIFAIMLSTLMNFIGTNYLVFSPKNYS